MPLGRWLLKYLCVKLRGTGLRHSFQTMHRLKKKTRPKRQSKVESESKEAESSPTWQQDPEVLQQTKKAKNAKNLNPIVSE